MCYNIIIIVPPIIISLIRLEFNSEDCEYYTELDAVKLVGVIPKSELLLEEGIA